jgi:hypothetical protein
MSLLLISLLLGMVLGQRFKVLVLLPAMVFLLLVAIGVGMANAQGLGPTALMAVGALASLQVGYLAGVGVRYLLTGTRSAKRRSVKLGAQPVRGAQSPAL